MSTNTELIQALRAALAASPESAPLHKHLADLLMPSGEFEQAIEEYRRALTLAPEADGIKLALAQAYHRQGKTSVALVILEELMDTPQPTAEALLLAARVYLDLEESEQAASAYRRAVAADPTCTDAEIESQLSAQPFDEPEEKDESKPKLVRIAAEGKDGPEATDVAEIEQPQITFEDVGGMEKVKEEIRIKIIHPIAHPEIYQAYGKSIGGGILMYGPPGCGKTHLARATAGEVQASFVAVGLHDVLDMYMGQSEHNLHNIFELARRTAPCVLFFDEVDALGAKRSDLRYSSMRQVINQFLSELDGIHGVNEGVLVLAATNAPWHLDSALRRPGRFDRVIFVPPPDQEAREAILRILLTDKPTRDVDYPKLARATSKFSGADLKGAVDTAVEEKLREAMKRGIPTPLTTRDLHAAIKQVRPTTQDWFETARNYAIYANQSGLYNEILDYLKLDKGSGFFSGSPFRGS